MSDFMISISAGKDKQSSSAAVVGNSVRRNIITDQERYIFDLNDSQLKDAVEKHFGRRPNSAYLHSPTGWTNLYKKYNLMETYTVVTATSAEVLEVISKDPMDLMPTMSFNNSQCDIQATWKPTISNSVSSSIRITWDTKGITSDQKITYKIGISGVSDRGETSISFIAPWGENHSELNDVTVGCSSSAVCIHVNPQQSLRTTLSVTPCVMKVRVQYNAYLVGTVAMKYSSDYKGQRVWGLPIAEVMSAGGVPNSVELTQDIEVKYCSNCEITAKDVVTDQVVLFRGFL